MSAPAVDLNICLAFLKRYLSGFRGYPYTGAGENRFAEALQANAVSVEHLEAILQSFEEDFPTVRNINDVAHNLLPRFQPEEDRRAEWERQYGKPQVFQYPADEMAAHWQAFRDLLFYTEGPGAGPVTHEESMRGGYWAEGMKRALDPEWGNHGETLNFIRKQAREMGWPAIMAPVPFPYTNPLHRRKKSAVFATPGAIISQADIDRAVQQRKSTAQVDKELDGWDDPDR